MKRESTLKASKTNPFTPEQMAQALANAPDVAVHDKDVPETTAADWRDSVVSHSLPELREQLAKRRIGRPIEPNPKRATTLRLSPDVMDAFRATGKGWQTRVDDALKDWLKNHPRPKH